MAPASLAARLVVVVEPARRCGQRGLARGPRRQLRGAAVGVVAASAVTLERASSPAPTSRSSSTSASASTRGERALAERLFASPAAPATPPTTRSDDVPPPRVRRSPGRGASASTKEAAQIPGSQLTAPAWPRPAAAGRSVAPAAGTDTDRLGFSRTVSQSRAAARSRRFSAAGTAAAPRCLTAAQEVALSHQLRAGLAVERVREKLSAAASDAEWAFACGLPSATALHAVLSQAQSARSLLLSRNIGLVKTVAHRFKNSLGNVRFDDLIVYGLVGLRAAVERFDPERGYRFSTFAYASVEAAQRRAIQNGRSSLRIPVWIQEVQAKLAHAQVALAADGVLQPTDEQLAAAANAPLGHVHAVATAFSRSEASWEVISEWQDSTGGAGLPDADSDAAPVAQPYTDADPFVTSAVQHWEEQLQSNTCDVLRGAYGLDGGAPKSIRELAERHGMKQRDVTKLVSAGLRTMRTT